MRMLKKITGVTGENRIRNRRIKSNLGVVSIVVCINDNGLRWFEHIKRDAVKILIQMHIETKKGKEKLKNK